MKEYIERDAARDLMEQALADEWEIQYADDRLDEIPAADVVDGESYRELLKVAKKMHFWIFLNTDDELGAYDECGLTDEMNALLGYDGQFTVKMDSERR